MALPPTQPPGWYYAQGDPPATHRWWDGAQWVGGPVANGAAAGRAGAATMYQVPYPSAYGQRPRFANFGQRLLALIIDWIIIGVPLGIFIAGYLAVAPTQIEGCVVDGRNRLCEVPTDGSIAILVFICLAVAVAWIVLYYGRYEGRTGQTIGKRALGIKTVGVATGRPLGTGRSIGRFFAHYLSGFACYLGYLWMLWDDKCQTWHDKITDSVVVRVDE